MSCIEGLYALSHRVDYLSKKNGITSEIKFLTYQIPIEKKIEYQICLTLFLLRPHSDWDK